MNFELGKKYIVEVTEKGVIPIDEFSEERYFNKDFDDLDFLTDEEKTVVVNDVLDKIIAEIMQLYNRMEVVDYDHNDISRIKKAHWIIREEVLWIIGKYTCHSYCEKCLRKGLEESKSLNDLYKRIYDHHHEINLTEDSEYKRGLLTLSNWVLDLFDNKRKQESEGHRRINGKNNI